MENRKAAAERDPIDMHCKGMKIVDRMERWKDRSMKDRKVHFYV